MKGQKPDLHAQHMSTRRSASAHSSRASGTGRGHLVVSSPGSGVSSHSSEHRSATVTGRNTAAKGIVANYDGNTKLLLADIRRAKDRLLALACHQGKSHNILIVADGTQYQQKVTREIVTSTNTFLHMLETMAKKRGQSRVSDQKLREREALLGKTNEWHSIKGYLTATTSYSPVHVLDSFVGLLRVISSGLGRTMGNHLDGPIKYITENRVSTRNTVQYLCSLIKHVASTGGKGYYEVNGTLLDAFNTRIVTPGEAQAIQRYIESNASGKSKLLAEFSEWKNQTLFQYLQGRRRPSSKNGDETLAKIDKGKHYVSTSAGFTIAVICTVPLAAFNENDANHIAKAILSTVNVNKAKKEMEGRFGVGSRPPSPTGSVAGGGSARGGSPRGGSAGGGARRRRGRGGGGGGGGVGVGDGAAGGGRGRR